MQYKVDKLQGAVNSVEQKVDAFSAAIAAKRAEQQKMEQSREEKPKGISDVADALVGEAGRNYERMNVLYVNYRDIDTNDRNFYHVDDIATLKESIATIGLKQPLIVKKQENGRYRLLGGERRYTALCELISEGKYEQELPCVLQDYSKISLPISDDLKEMYVLITTNREQRKYTDADILSEIEELKVIYAALREAGVEKITLGIDENGNEVSRDIKGVKTRTLLAEDLQMSERTVGSYEKVSSSAGERLRALVEKQGIAIATAAKVTDLPKDKQDALYEKFEKTGERITDKDIQDARIEKIVQRKKKLAPVMKQYKSIKKLLEEEKYDDAVTALLDMASKVERLK